MASDPSGFLTLRAGAFHRITRATAAAGALRVVSISNCPVTNWLVIAYGADNKLDGKKFGMGEKLDVHVFERRADELLWTEDPEKIGALARDSVHANVHVPPEAFAEFWHAAETQVGSTHSVELELKSDGSDTLRVTNIGLFEAMPPPPINVSDDGRSAAIPAARLHPVVAELRTMREG